VRWLFACCALMIMCSLRKECACRCNLTPALTSLVGFRMHRNFLRKSSGPAPTW
jgi:hypothetical protein